MKTWIELFNIDLLDPISYDWQQNPVDIPTPITKITHVFGGKTSFVAGARPAMAQRSGSFPQQLTNQMKAEYGNLIRGDEELQNLLKGDTGISILSVDVLYYLSSSATSPVNGTWQTTPPPWENGKYMFTKNKTVYSNGAFSETIPVNITGSRGADGTSVTIKGAKNTVSELPSTGNTNGDAYIVQGDMHVWSGSSWSNVGRFEGQPGQDGRGILATVVHYQNHTSGTSAPTGTWSTVLPTPVKGKYLWTRITITYTDSSQSVAYSTSYYATDGVKGDTGSPGRSVSAMQEQYYLSTSNTTQTGGAWQNTSPTWTKDKYIWTRIKIDYTNPTVTEYTTPVLNGITTGAKAYVDSEVTLAKQALSQSSLQKGVSYAGVQVDDINGFSQTATFGNTTVIYRANVNQSGWYTSDGVFLGGMTMIGGRVGLMTDTIATPEERNSRYIRPRYGGEMFTGGAGLSFHSPRTSTGTTPWLSGGIYMSNNTDHPEWGWQFGVGDETGTDRLIVKKKLLEYKGQPEDGEYGQKFPKASVSSGEIRITNSVSGVSLTDYGPPKYEILESVNYDIITTAHAPMRWLRLDSLTSPMLITSSTDYTQATPIQLDRVLSPRDVIAVGLTNNTASDGRGTEYFHWSVAASVGQGVSTQVAHRVATVDGKSVLYLHNGDGSLRVDRIYLLNSASIPTLFDTIGMDVG